MILPTPVGPIQAQRVDLGKDLILGVYKEQLIKCFETVDARGYLISYQKHGLPIPTPALQPLFYSDYKKPSPSHLFVLVGLFIMP